MGSATSGRPLAGLLRLAAAAAVVVVAGACSPPAEAPSADPPATTPTATTDEPDGPAGEADPAALSGFVCAPDDDGTWAASGTLTNSGADDADYVLTVLVAGPTSTTAQAKRQRVTLAGGESLPVELTSLPAPAEGELSCQAQVVRRA